MLATVYLFFIEKYNCSKEKNGCFVVLAPSKLISDQLPLYFPLPSWMECVIARQALTWKPMTLFLSDWNFSFFFLNFSPLTVFPLVSPLSYGTLCSQTLGYFSCRNWIVDEWSAWLIKQDKIFPSVTLWTDNTTLCPINCRCRYYFSVEVVKLWVRARTRRQSICFYSS